MSFPSSNPVDRYLRREYERVPGMSSRFSALVASVVMRTQCNAGWTGGAAEIGAFEGRFTIALALTLAPGERAVAVDLFEWPDADVGNRFRQRLLKHGVASACSVIEADSRTLTAADLRERGGGRFRFFHIDGDHGPESLASDMRLAFDCMAPWGVVCLDDMLSPAYPELVSSALEVIASAGDWRVFCVVDRESICASAKFLVARPAYADFYVRALALRLGGNVWRMGAQFSSHRALVLSPEPLLVRFNPGGTVSRIAYQSFLD